MRVDDQPVDSSSEQMIEGECDEGFLENRHERLRQIVRQRLQAYAKAGGENKSLRDHRLVLASATAKNGPMAEETLWRGTSSQWKNAPAFVLSILIMVAIFVMSLVAARLPQLSAAAPFILLALVFPVALIFARYLRTKTKVYELTTERLKITEGIFSRVTDTLELYRVKDLETRQPFSSRVCRLENVQLNTSDSSTPFVLIDAVPSRLGLGDKVRNAVEAVRMQKRVREIDIE